MTDPEAGVPPAPWTRYGWLLWGAWLIFLVFPVLASLDADSAALTALGLGGTLAFAVVYAVGVGVVLHDERPRRGAAPVLVALVLLVLATAPAIGLNVMSFLPFLQSYGVFALPRPVNWWWSAAVVTTALALPLALDPSSGFFFLFFIVVAVALGTGSGRLMADQAADYTRVRDELTVTAERDRVARDVHDVLGHSLTVVSVKAELAARLLDRDPVRARAELVEIQGLARQALAEVRATVGGLRATGLDEELAGAAVALRAAGIAAELPASGTALDPRRRAVAAWVLREAVTNVVRHSGAARCTVELGESCLRIVDDGCGLGDQAPGHGLQGLRERVEASGARLGLGTPAGGGTAVEVQW